MSSAFYRGSIDGDIEEYLKFVHDNRIVCPAFIGYEPFKQLWDMGVMLPYIASIRLLHGQGMDEHYYVVDENHLEGIALKAHSGKPGLHDAKEILTNTRAPCWEADGLDPRAYRG